MANDPRAAVQTARPHSIPAKLDSIVVVTPLLAVFLSVSLTASLPRSSPAAPADSPRRLGAIGMPDPSTASLLVSYYDQFLRDQDLEEFRRQVNARYIEGTLARLTEAPDTHTRRAAVFALGLVGTYQANGSAARALRDPDPTVRSLAENALWAIWFRADTPENNTELERIGLLISHRRFEDAIGRATRLIERAPTFAEVYNQRAIAHFNLGQFQESADDCRRVLERNPFHIGALAGLAKCLLRLEKREDALEALRRSSRLQPFNVELRNVISELENGDD
ncbi:MAG: tetratricopeptide repeat protein [Isosphaeraceae bacterium]